MHATPCLSSTERPPFLHHLLPGLDSIQNPRLGSTLNPGLSSTLKPTCCREVFRGLAPSWPGPASATPLVRAPSSSSGLSTPTDARTEMNGSPDSATRCSAALRLPLAALAAAGLPKKLKPPPPPPEVPAPERVTRMNWPAPADSASSSAEARAVGSGLPPDASWSPSTNTNLARLGASWVGVTGAAGW